MGDSLGTSVGTDGSGEIGLGVILGVAIGSGTDGTVTGGRLDGVG